MALIPPSPVGSPFGSYTWADWYEKVRRAINDSATIKWSQITTFDAGGLLPVSLGGTATATPALVAGTNITITGVWPNQTINTPTVTTITGNAGTATKLQTARLIGGTSFDGTADITPALVTAATKLNTARNINGVAFDGTANITVTADASTLTGSTLNSGVTASSLTSLGNLSSLTVSGTAKIGTTGAITASGAEIVGSANTLILRNTNSASYAGMRVYNDQNSGFRALEIDYMGSTYATGEAAYISCTGAFPMYLGTNNTPRITIDSSGLVGIAGATVSGILFAINGTAANPTNSNIYLSGRNTGASQLRVVWNNASANYVGIGEKVTTGGIIFGTSASNTGTSPTIQMEITSSGVVLSPFGVAATSGNTGSIGNGVATTVYTLGAAAGNFKVAARLPAGAGGPTNYSASAEVNWDGTAGRITANNAALLTITLSGANIQVTQSSGGTQPGGVNWSVLYQYLP